ncbi:PilZ domain-containing protein [Idiomarina sp. X4]|uniref:PilZ domain-containing protein n=1 Tax=Idiomarina sp. X4 TaxID=2055892 RepID=UPI000C2874C0|nr:PilZ domain-containing protein [Idiomarina sp. X4]ATZ72473.1 PilZ domain-containing protein [Idiomarina sp. X4]
MTLDAALQTLVDELKTEYHRSQFESVFKRKTKHLSGPEKLKVKMAITELAKPALGVVDLRKKVPYDVFPYPFQGRTHYFHNRAQQLFEQGLKAYKGVFTEDTKQQILALKNQYNETGTVNAPATSLDSFIAGHPYARREERMNFVSPVSFTLADGQLFKASTVDISTNGLQLKVESDEQVKSLLFAQLDVRFSGLAENFVISGEPSVQYRVVAIENSEPYVYLRLKRLETDNNKAFRIFIDELIGQYKHRYKVNIDHSLQRVKARAYEALWANAYSGLKLVLADNKPTCCALASEANRTLLNSWQKHAPNALSQLMALPWVRQERDALKLERKQSRRQLCFFRLSLPLNKRWHEYLIPVTDLSNEDGWLPSLFALKQAGYPVQAYALTITYDRHRMSTFAELQKLALPMVNEVKVDKLALSKLKPYQLEERSERKLCVVPSDDSNLEEQFGNALSNALFVHKDGTKWLPKVAGLMPFSEGLPTAFKDAGFWLSDSEKVLGGRQLQRQLMDNLKRTNEPVDLPAIVVLRISHLPGKETVIGRSLNTYKTFSEAAEYVNFLNDDGDILAFHISGSRSNACLSDAVRGELSYISRYLPHRASEFEAEFLQCKAVLTVSDVTESVIALAALVKQPNNMLQQAN